MNTSQFIPLVRKFSYLGPSRYICPSTTYMPDLQNSENYIHACFEIHVSSETCPIANTTPPVLSVCISAAAVQRSTSYQALLRSLTYSSSSMTSCFSSSSSGASLSLRPQLLLLASSLLSALEGLEGGGGGRPGANAAGFWCEKMFAARN